METNMTKHDRPTGASIGEDRVLDKKQAGAVGERTLEKYDATVHVGLRTIVCHAAIERIDEEGEETIELPKPRQLRTSAAMVRCLMPIRLRGSEIRAVRTIMGLTLAERASMLDEKTAVETVSRWETEAQPMGGYAEKILRLLVCEQLKSEAPGVEYNGSMIAQLKVKDPWRADPDYVVPNVVLTLIQMKEQSGSIIETWNAKKAA
jgi:DNA-binding transcriptional regulator YiaG